MKTLALLLLTAALAFTPGCQTQNTAGRLLASSVQTVDAGMQSWWSYEVLGHATPDQVALVRAAYADYQAVEQLAESAYLAATKSGDTSAWQRAADALTASQKPLLALIQQFTKDKTTNEPRP
jgi:hypothetical protein